MTPDTNAGRGQVGPLDVAAFVCEVAMLFLLGLSGWRLFEGAASKIAAMIGLPFGAVVVWGTLMAPTSRRRLANPGRLLAQVALFLVSAVLAAESGLLWWGVGWAATAVVVVSALMLSSDTSRRS